MGSLQDVIERVKRELDLRTLIGGSIPPSGKIRCPLPGHEDKNPSFDVDAQRNTFTCWSHPGGRVSGSVLDFLMLQQGVDFKEALRIGADQLHIPLKSPTKAEVAAQEARHKREETLTALTRAAHGWLMGGSDTACRARAYLEGRGYSRELLREHHVGLIHLEKLYQIRTKHPVLADYSQADFEAAGLRGKSGGLLFRDTRILFPLMHRGCTTGMSFRALPDPTDKKPKFMHLSGVAAGLWNEDALYHPDREVVLAEGIPDALQVSAFGLPAVGNLGLETANNAQRFAHLKRVTLVWDNDKAGRGSVMKSALAILAALKDGDVHVLHMPGEKDINDWARAGGTKEEFLTLVAEAPSLVNAQIEALPTSAETLRDEDLHPVLRTVLLMPSVRQEHYLGQIAKHVQTSRAIVRRQLSVVEAALAKKSSPVPASGSDAVKDKVADSERGEGTLVPRTFQTIQPGLDLVVRGGIPSLHMGIYLKREFKTVKDDKELITHDVKQELIVATAQPAGLEIRTAPYDDEFPYNSNAVCFPGSQYPCWSQSPERAHNMLTFLKSPSLTPCSAQVFQRGRALLADYLWFADSRELDLIATWILLTYVYPVFSALPYLHFHGGKGSGKTTALDLIHRLAFSALKCGNPTEAAISYHCSNTGGTLVIDETERLVNPKPDSRDDALMQILLIGYKKGAILPKGNAEKHQTEERSVFGPKCLGSIGGLHHVLRERCITIHMRVAGRGVPGLRSAFHDDLLIRSQAEDLRDHLHIWALTTFAQLFQLHSTTMREAHVDRLANRQRELWMPLLTLARRIDVEAGGSLHVEETLLSLQTDKREDSETQEAEEDPRLLYLSTLSHLLKEQGGLLCASNGSTVHRGWYSLATLLVETETILHAQRRLPQFVNHDANWLRKVLLEADVMGRSDKKQIRLARQGGTTVPEVCYHITPEGLERAMARFQVEKQVDEQTDEIPTPPAETAVLAPFTQTPPELKWADEVPF